MQDRDAQSRRFLHPDALSASRPLDDASAEAPLEQGRPQGPLPKPPRNRARGVRRFFGFLLLIILVGALGYGAYVVSIVAKISTNPWQFGPVSADSAGRTNVLVLGVGDPGHAGEQLSDSIMVVSVDSSGKRVAQISLPRDLRVDIPGHGSGKINSANALGGVTLAEQTVSNTLDLPVDYYVKTNFGGLKDIVDAVGGLDIDVKEKLVDTEFPCDDNQYKSCGLVIPAGMQHMDGTQVLHYVRCRKGTCGNDFGRSARQQEVLALLKPKLLDPQLLLHPGQLTNLVAAVGKGIETDIGFIQMLQLANTVRSAGSQAPISLVLSTGNGGMLRNDPSGTSDLVPIGGSYTAISQAVNAIFSQGQ